MKTLCITGLMPSHNAAVYRIMASAGLAAPRPTLREPALSMDDWHARVLDKHEPGKGDALAPGRLWQQLAGDLFLANLDSPVWGWSDARSVPLLDFWRDFDQNLYFILVSVTPEQFLADAIAAGQGELDAVRMQDEWAATQRELLRFHLRHPERSVLVQAAQAVQAPATLVERCRTRWKLPLSVSQAAAPALADAGAMALHLAGRMMQASTGHAALHHEVDAALLSLGKEAAAAAPAGLATVVDEFRALRAGERLRVQVESQLAQTRQQATQAEQRAATLDQQRRALEEQLAAARQEAEASAQRHATDLKRRQARIQELEQESAQLTTALQEVQVQLQAVVAKHATLEAAAAAEQARLQAALAELGQQHGAALAALGQQHAAALAALEQQHGATLAARDKKQAAAQAAQAAREKTHAAELATLGQQHAAALASGRQQRAALEKKAAELAQEQARLSARLQAADAARERDAARAAAEIKRSQARRKEVEQENAQLLRQLQSLQVEYERALAKRIAPVQVKDKAEQKRLEEARAQVRVLQSQLQAIEQQRDMAVALGQRLLGKLPGKMDIAAIELLPRGEHPSEAVRCRLHGLTWEGRTWDVLEFGILLEHGMAGFAFERAPDGTSPLLRWPAAAHGRDRIEIIPAAHPSEGRLRVELLRQLASRDWKFVCGLIEALPVAMAGLDEQADSEVPGAMLLNGLDKMRKTLALFPPILRFDRVTLRAAHSDPHYEHVELALHDVDFGDRSSPCFEFRVACAKVPANHFGDHPRLEFPVAASQFLDSWAGDTQGIAGPQMELRMAMPEAMDMQVWHGLSSADRNFVRALVETLPEIAAGVPRERMPELARAWEEWGSLCGEIGRIMRIRLAAPAAVEQS